MRRLALAAVVALAAVASACSGVESQPDLWVESQPDFVQAAQRTASLPSYAYEVRMHEINLGERREIVCSGLVDNVRPAARHACKGGWHERAEIRRIDTTSYQEVLGTDAWIRAPDADLIAAFSSTSPTSILETLEYAVRARRVGDEVVRGEPTVRYRVTVDCRPDGCDEWDVEAWIDGDGLVRRVDTLNTIAIDFFDFGVPVEVQEPSPDEIEEPRDRARVPCGSQLAAPITVDDAVDAFRRHGFDLGPWRKMQCLEDVAEYLVSRGEWKDVVRSPGYLYCTVSAEGWDGAHPQWDVIHARASHYVENLGCLLAVTGPREPERVQAFEDALKELKREHGS